MEEYIELRKNWWWPKHDIACWKYLSRRQDVPKNVASYTEKKRVVVQAGGNAGMYVKMYEEIFDIRIKTYEEQSKYFDVLEIIHTDKKFKTISLKFK